MKFKSLPPPSYPSSPLPLTSNQARHEYQKIYLKRLPSNLPPTFYTSQYKPYPRSNHLQMFPILAPTFLKMRRMMADAEQAEKRMMQK
ncbi:MAG: hypothetical protein L6R36_003214 [Xanthoria steineri]|nr:MAG: hypothetical protein L6R36_003214 [Xanthoria steineri]